MKLDSTTTNALRKLIAEAAFNTNNIQIADHVIHQDKWEIFFESKHAPVDDLADAALLTLSVEDADYLIGKCTGDGLAYGFEYLLNIHLDMDRRKEIEEYLMFILGWAFMAVRVQPIETMLEREVA